MAHKPKVRVMGFEVPDELWDRLETTISGGLQQGLREFNPFELLDSLCKPWSGSSIQYLTWVSNSGTPAVNSRSGTPTRLSETLETLLLYYVFSMTINDAVAPLVSDNLYEDANGFTPRIEFNGTPIFGGDFTGGLVVPSDANPISFAPFVRHGQSFLVGANEAGSLSGLIPVLLRCGPGGTLRWGYNKNASQHSYLTSVSLAITTVPAR